MFIVTFGADHAALFAILAVALLLIGTWLKLDPTLQRHREVRRR